MERLDHRVASASSRQWLHRNVNATTDGGVLCGGAELLHHLLPFMTGVCEWLPHVGADLRRPLVCLSTFVL